MNNTPLNPDDEARLKKALEQSANGQVVSRGRFAQYAKYAQTPLNQKAFEYAEDHCATYGEYSTFREQLRMGIKAYLAVAQPVVTTQEELDALPHETVIRDSQDFVFEKIGLHGKDPEWWCTTDFLNETKVTLPVRVLYRPESGHDV